MVNVNHHVVFLHTDTACHGAFNAHVCLMRNNPCNVILGEIVALCNKFHCIRHICHSVLEHSTTFLVNEVETLVNGFMTRHVCRATCCHVKVFVSFTIHTQVTVHQTIVFFCRFHHHACCAIAKDGASVAVLIVGHGGHMVTTTNDDTLITSAADEACTSLHRIEETCTCCLHVKTKGVLQIKVANDE